GKSSSIEELIFADEVVGFLKTIVNGQPVDEYTLAEEVINKVGPGGNFLAEPMTAHEARKQWKSSCIKGLTFEELQQTDMPDLGQRLRARGKEIVANGPQNPLPEGIAKELDKIVRRAIKRVEQD
ncbi:MAG: trimethylamine methyltransferase family protein, partial [Bacillota bacterium]|nr:trimethylamine methyltransferase family protein [Bacillota bacterium]